MFNLIKMNFYRLLRQRSFYVMIASAALISGFMVFMVWLTPVIEEKMAEENIEKTESAGGFHVGITAGRMEESDSPASVFGAEVFNVTEFADEFFSSGFYILLISIGAALIANSERKRGFIKNLGGQMKPRGLLTLSKLPVILFEAAAMCGAAILSIVLLGRLLYEKYTLGNVPAMCKAVSVQLLLGLAFGALILLVCIICRSAASGIFVGILLSSGLVETACFFINRLASAYLGAPADFDISKCLLSYYNSGITSVASGRMTAAALAVGAAYLLLASAAGCLVMEKRDII